MCKFYQFCNGKSGDGENGEKPERKIFTQCPPYTVFAKGIVIIMKDKTFSNRISGLTKKDIITIPNILSMFRLILIPLIFVFWFRDEYVFTFITVAVSAFTDVLDGFIARKFKMITDIGKFLDPLADKLTQLSVLICLTLKYRWIIAAVILLAVKELTMLAAGTRVLKKTDRMPYARWYGKAATAALDVSTALVVLFPDIPEYIVVMIFTVCAALIIYSLVRYLMLYRTMIAEHAGKNSVDSKKGRN